MFSVCTKGCMLSLYILPLRPKFWSISLYNHLFSRYKVAENRKCTEWPTKYLSLSTEAQILVRFALKLAVSEIHVQGWWKSEMHRMSPKWTWTLNSQKWSTKVLVTYPWGLNFPPFCSRICGFQDTRSPKIRMHQMTPTELEHLTVKNTLYTLNTYPWGTNFGPFCSTISSFWFTTCTGLSKIGNAPNDPKMNLNT